MTRFCLFVLLVALGASGPVSTYAQTTDGALPLSSDVPPVRVAVTPAFERFEDDGRTLTQWSTQVSAVVPITSHLQVRAATRATDATVTVRDSTTAVRGLADLRASLLYARTVGDGSLVLGLDANVPTGSTQLTPEEVRTTVYLAQQVYRMRVPGLGRGFNVTPRVTYALPVGDAVALGVGASFRYQGAYRPAAGTDGRYQPGHELEVFAGVDVTASRTVTVSADASYARYGTDEVGGRDRFEPGGRAIGTVQVAYEREAQRLLVTARGQYRGTSSLLPRNPSQESVFVDPALEDRQIVPSMASLRIRYHRTLTDRVRAGLYARGFHYEATTLMDAQTMGTAGLTATIRLADALAVTPQVAYTLGGVSGVEAALRTSLRF